MALELKVVFREVDFINQIFRISDITGMETLANPGGYGINSSASNPSKLASDQEIHSFLIEVTRPDNSVITKNVSNISFVDPQDNDGYDVVDYTISNNKAIENGLYSFKFIVNEQGGELDSITITQYIYNLDELETKINAKFATDLDFCNFPDCSCNKSLLTLWSYYRALKAAVEEQNSVKADYLSTQILKIIN